MTKTFAQVPERAVMEADARAQAGLDDFGDPWLFAHLDALIPVLNSEAKLSEAGAATARGMITGALINRLRHVDLLKRHPEIRDEEVRVAAVVAGLPRTGSTMLHRMLAAAPGMTGVRWYEAQNYVPFPGEARGDPAPRRAAAEQIMAYMLQAIPDLMSLHPMSIDQPDEEVIILGQLFSSTMIEGTYFAPSYARWLMASDRARPYRDLKEILQSLQWQDASRKGARWVLKTPGHLMAMDAALEAFPEAKMVMTHRDPVSTVPSYCSMEWSLYQMVSQDVSREDVAGFWAPRLKELLDAFMAVRDEAGAEAFVDVRYEDQLADPVGVGERVLRACGIEPDDAVRRGMAEWIEANKREHRAPHRYGLEDFGLTEQGVKALFADYRARFIEV